MVLTDGNQLESAAADLEPRKVLKRNERAALGGKSHVPRYKGKPKQPKGLEFRLTLSDNITMVMVSINSCKIAR